MKADTVNKTDLIKLTSPTTFHGIFSVDLNGNGSSCLERLDILFINLIEKLQKVLLQIDILTIYYFF